MSAPLPPPDERQSEPLLNDPALIDEFVRVTQVHRGSLRAMVAARLDDALQKRIDPSDVVQESLVIALSRLGDFVRRKPMSLELWLRKTTLQRLVDLRRKHYAMQRDARTEIAISDHSALILAGRAAAHSPDAPQQAMHGETVGKVRSAIADLDVSDREILLLHYVDGLTIVETAELLQIEPSAASKRHGRALVRLATRLRTLGIGDG